MARQSRDSECRGQLQTCAINHLSTHTEMCNPYTLCRLQQNHACPGCGLRLQSNPTTAILRPGVFACFLSPVAGTDVVTYCTRANYLLLHAFEPLHGMHGLIICCKCAVLCCCPCQMSQCMLFTLCLVSPANHSPTFADFSRQKHPSTLCHTTRPPCLCTVLVVGNWGGPEGSNHAASFKLYNWFPCSAACYISDHHMSVSRCSACLWEKGSPLCVICSAALAKPLRPSFFWMRYVHSVKPAMAVACCCKSVPLLHPVLAQVAHTEHAIFEQLFERLVTRYHQAHHTMHPHL